ncbi:hypothetical protein GCM10007385_05130 [Tateyamaria omphalii]|uniref:GNAT family N-acetyltransferase n=1 Tax=Tateyamaria omphalii TaxID=299262 RepID=UPI001672BB34|nr:GNAT family N-acetyltransferase [Tateyamaria omphalii]GGX40689.1 hypothetical protein GCM10007385_05130 [Tateyamaria omphalii]
MIECHVKPIPENRIQFVRLSSIDPSEILEHMSNPRVGEHLPLLTEPWDDIAVTEFVTAKEACWERDGLGHWAILHGDRYVGWGGFQKESEGWDFGLVLKPDAFGLGVRIAKKALEFAAADARIPFVTFLLPPSRKNLGALKRLGAKKVEDVLYDNVPFHKYRCETVS